MKTVNGVNGTEYTVGTSAILLYPAAGGSDDYAHSIGIKYTYTIELRDKAREGGFGFLLPKEQIKLVGAEALSFVMTVAEST